MSRESGCQQGSDPQIFFRRIMMATMPSTKKYQYSYTTFIDLPSDPMMPVTPSYAFSEPFHILPIILVIGLSDTKSQTPTTPLAIDPPILETLSAIKFPILTVPSTNYYPVLMTLSAIKCPLTRGLPLKVLLD